MRNVPFGSLGKLVNILESKPKTSLDFTSKKKGQVFHKLARAVSLAVGPHSGGHLALGLVTTIPFVLLFFFYRRSV